MKNFIIFLSYQIACFGLGVLTTFILFSIALMEGSIFSLFTNIKGITLLIVGGFFGWLFFGGAKSLDWLESEENKCD